MLVTLLHLFVVVAFFSLVFVIWQKDKDERTKVS